MKELTSLEQKILASIICLEQNAYGVSIRIKVEKLTNERIMYGTLYNALDQLLRKGYVTKTNGAASVARAGRPRIYYTLTESGKEALRTSFRKQQALWASIPEFLGD